MYLCRVKSVALLFMALLSFGLTAIAASKKPYPGGKQYIWRLTLRDKAGSPYSLDRPQRWLSNKSVERRRRQGLALDSTDLPVSPMYVNRLRAEKGACVVGQSRWNNTVLVGSTDTTILQRLASQPFVTKAECVWISPDSVERVMKEWTYNSSFNPWDSVKSAYYGNGQEQIEMLNGHRLHARGYRGHGMTIAVLDGGFLNADRIPALERTRIAGTRNLVCPMGAIANKLTVYGTADDDAESAALYRSTDHGTKVLSAMAADCPKVLVGTAPDARYWLLRCEDRQTEQPVEEDYWTMAAEFADSAGVDIISSSLGYNEYDGHRGDYRLRDLDGKTALISRTASLLARKGIILINSAGNLGMGPWKKITFPADAEDILTVGAVNNERKNAPFCGVGPTQDGRVKPDVLALGSPASLISGRGTLIRDMGTSFSTPIVAGLVACLWQSLPNKTALEIIHLVRQTSSQHQEPDNIYGYGIPNFWRAYMIGKIE